MICASTAQEKHPYNPPELYQGRIPFLSGKGLGWQIDSLVRTAKDDANLSPPLHSLKFALSESLSGLNS